MTFCLQAKKVKKAVAAILDIKKVRKSENKGKIMNNCIVKMCPKRRFLAPACVEISRHNLDDSMLPFMHGA